MRVAVIDGDTMLWIAAYLNREQEEPKFLFTGLDNIMIEILKNTKADQYCGFLQGEDNSHRHKMFSDYKANRPPRPEWLTRWKPDIQAYLAGPYSIWKFEYANGVETDDAVASVASILTQQEHTPIICSIDKDLKQIAGEHYNYKTKEKFLISEAEANRILCLQLMTGDVTDNIKGLKGIGPVKAEKIVHDGEEEGIAPSLAVLEQFIKRDEDLSVANGMLSFAEAVIKTTLKRDLNYRFKLNDLPISLTTHKETAGEENIPF